MDYQAPLSMEFSKQEYWSGLPRPPPGDLPDPGIEPSSLMSPSIGRQVLYHLSYQGSQEHWGALPFPRPQDLPDLWIKPRPPGSPALAGRFFNSELLGKPLYS